MGPMVVMNSNQTGEGRGEHSAAAYSYQSRVTDGTAPIMTRSNLGGREGGSVWETVRFFNFLHFYKKKFLLFRLWSECWSTIQNVYCDMRIV